MKNSNFETKSPTQETEQDAQENAQEKNVENAELKEQSAEFYKSKMDQAHENLMHVQKNANRIDEQSGKLAGLREKLGITSDADTLQMQDKESAQLQLEVAKNEFRSAFGDWGRSLAQEKFGKDGEISHEDALKALYSEKVVETDEIDESGVRVSRTLAQEYELRLKKTQEASQEEMPAHKRIATKLFEKYNNLSRGKKVAVGTMIAASIGAATGGASAAVMMGANKLVKVKLSGLIAGGADALLQKHMQKRDEKNLTRDSDFEQRMNEVAEESFVQAVEGDGSVEQGILEGVEKRMKVLDEMIAHQKSKQKVRMVTAAASGVLIGGGLFDADEAMAGTGIKSGSFDFGGSKIGSVQESMVTDAVAGQAQNVEFGKTNTATAEWSDDDWDIPEENRMRSGLERPAGVIPNADGKTMEADIRPDTFRAESVQDPENATSVQETVSQEVGETNVDTVVEHIDVFDQLTPRDIEMLKNVDAGSLMSRINDSDVAGTESAMELRKIQTRLGYAEIGQSMQEYLEKYDKPLTVSEARAITSFIRENTNAVG